MSARDTPDPQWLQGFVAALASVDRMHDRPSFVVDVMNGYGVSVADLKRVGVEDYDLDVIRKAMKGTTVRRKSSATTVGEPVVEAREQPSARGDRPWLAYVDGVMLRSSNGVGRRFASPGAAESAAHASIANHAGREAADLAPLAAYDSRMALVETMLNAPRGEPLPVSEILDELSIAAQYWAREVVKAYSFESDSRAIRALMIADTMSGEVRDKKSAKRLLVFLNALPEYPSTGSHGGPARRYKETLERTAQASRGQR